MVANWHLMLVKCQALNIHVGLQRQYTCSPYKFTCCPSHQCDELRQLQCHVPWSHPCSHRNSWPTPSNLFPMKIISDLAPDGGNIFRRYLVLALLKSSPCTVRAQWRGKRLTELEHLLAMVRCPWDEFSLDHCCDRL